MPRASMHLSYLVIRCPTRWRSPRPKSLSRNLDTSSAIPFKFPEVPESCPLTRLIPPAAKSCRFFHAAFQPEADLSIPSGSILSLAGSEVEQPLFPQFINCFLWSLHLYRTISFHVLS